MAHKILSVDDSAIIRKIIRGTVELLGYELLEAGDGDEALNVLEQSHPDIELIILDWNMPNKNGYDALVEMKQEGRFAHIPVMMLTTESEKQNIIRAIQAGAKHYMTKPFNPEDLMTKMMECLGQG